MRSLSEIESDSGRAGLLLAACGIVLLTLVAYLPALSAGFVWDDDAYVTENPLLHGVDGLRRIWTTTETPQYYPLVFTTFWTEHQLWGLQPLGYHLVNILLHAANAVLVGCVLRRLGIRGAWWVAALFAVHPVHVESVAWVTERKNVLSGLFYLLAFLSYLRFDSHGRRRHYGAALVLFLLALLSKTVTSSLPVVLGLALLHRNRSLSRTDVLRLVPFGLLALGMGAVTVTLESGMVEVVGREFGFSWPQRVLIAGKALLFYPQKLLVPYPLVFNYPRWDVTGAGWPQAWPVLLVGLAGCSMAWLWATRRRGVVLAVLFYAVTIFPALGFLDVYPFRYSFVADHFQYLASLGWLILMVQAAIAAGRLAGSRPWFAGLRRGAGLAVVLVLGMLTWNQSRAYASAETLWRDTIAKNPDSWIAHNNLGGIYLRRGSLERSLESFDRAIRCNPGSAESHTGRGQAQTRLGRLDEARRDFDRAIELDPTYPQALLHRGDLLLRAGDHRQSIRDLTIFLDANPSYFPAYISRAFAHVRSGQVELAVQDFSRAIELDGSQPAAYIDRGAAYLQLGRNEQAERDFDTAIRLDPASAKAYLNRGVTHARSGRPERACADWKRACELGDCRGYEKCRLE